ncbi:MAG: NAD(P)/FAD-dependent oxidoreductase [Arenicellales bacterium]
MTDRSQVGLGIGATWYAAPGPSRQPLPALDGLCQTEVCIVGGGLAGLVLAQELVNHGVDVVLIEAREIGAGASGRNGGFCSPGWAASDESIEKRLGLDRARVLYDLSYEGFALIRELLPELDRTPGHLQVSTYSNAKALRQFCEHRAVYYGQVLEYVDIETVRSCLKTTRYYQGVRDADAFHCNPLQLCQTLLETLQSSSVRVYEHTALTRFSAATDGWHIETPAGSVRAQKMVWCCGGYGGAEFSGLRNRFLPITTYIGVTSPLGPPLQDVIRTSDAVSDDRRAGNYYRLVGDNRLLWGGDITAFGRHDPVQIARRMAQDIAGIFPALALDNGHVPIEYAWSGLMGYARHMMPLVGQLSPGLWACTGFGGHGLNTSAAAARVVAEALTDRSDRWQLFSPFSFSWNGGAAGPTAVEICYRLMKLSDRWRAFRARRATRGEPIS